MVLKAITLKFWINAVLFVPATSFTSLTLPDQLWKTVLNTDIAKSVQWDGQMPPTPSSQCVCEICGCCLVTSCTAEMWASDLARAHGFLSCSGSSQVSWPIEIRALPCAAG